MPQTGASDSLSRQLLTIVGDCTAVPYAYYAERESFLRYWQEHFENIVWLYHALQDDESRKTLVGILRLHMGAHIAGGPRGANGRFAPFPADIWQGYCAQAETLYPDIATYALDKVETLVLEGYRHGNNVFPAEGDCVLDCGAYTGLTALWFAEQIGSGGTCHSFEASPDIFASLKKNVALHAGDNVHVHNFAITDKRKTVGFSAISCPGSHLDEGEDAINVPGISIDAFVAEQGLEHLDFIKMDIEGAELQALAGARETIAKYRPKLAICVYHKPDDLVAIPRAILDIAPNYAFYLKHNSNSFFETVLFAKPVATPIVVSIPAEEMILCRKAYDMYMQYFGKHLAHELGQRLELSKQYLARFNELSDKRFEVFGNDTCLGLAVSEDKDLHYAFVFAASGVKVCLRFESARWAKRSAELDAKLLVGGTTPFTGNFAEDGYEFAHLFANAQDIDAIANAMHELVEKTWPTLVANGWASAKTQS